MDTIDLDAEVTAESTRVRVTFRFANDHPEAVAVRLRQPITLGVAASQVAIDPEYDTGPWSASEDPLVFTRRLDRGATTETGYTIGGVDMLTVREILRAVTIEVWEVDGVELEVLEGSELRVDGQRLGTRDRSGRRGNTDLPAPVSDYALKDVNEVESSEFEWSSVDDDDTSGGLLGRLLPFL